MSTRPVWRKNHQSNEGPALCNGDRMKQAEFHRRSLGYPDDMKIELVGGIVYMTRRLSLAHSDHNDELGFLLGLYRRATPGVQVLHNATIILDEESEPQPDLGLRIRSDCVGQSWLNEAEYIEGAPELLAEIASSSRALDMHQKRDDYRRAGVVEYIVLCVEERELHWFHFPDDTTIRPNRQGVLRSRIFPGLWVHQQALLAQDSPRLIEVVQQGLASREHAAFVRRLEAARRRQS